MSPDVVTTAPDAPLEDALELMRTHGIRHIPVVEGTRLVGIATDRDLRLAMGAAVAGGGAAVPISEIMTRDVLTTTPGTPVEAAARLIIDNRIGCLPVVEDGELVGILTESDLLRAFVDLMIRDEPYSRVELLAPDRPGELARVVRLIGIDHRINITGVVVPPSKDRQALVVLHLETDDVRDLLSELRKLGYEAGSPALESRPE